jgi:hypothetical protein
MFCGVKATAGQQASYQTKAKGDRGAVARSNHTEADGNQVFGLGSRLRERTNTNQTMGHQITAGIAADATAAA